MPTTSNFGWTTPADTDLVKDGAAAIRTLGNGIDTSLVDLKGGTTGQVLSKNSNTDLDYTWITPNVGDITEVQAGTGILVASGTGPIPVVTNSMATEITAKGDLIVGTGSGTFDNLPVGTNGHTLVADSGETTGLKWAAPAGGGYTELASGTASGATLNLTSISGSYRNLQMILRNHRPSANGENLQMRFNSDTNTRYQTTNNNLDNALSFSNSLFQVEGPVNSSATNANALSIITVYDYANTSTYKFFEIISVNIAETNTANFNWLRRAGFYNQTGAITALNFLWTASVNFSSGTYVLYGVK